jgi:poly(hydroxyalkanoate) granule-associated protein
MAEKLKELAPGASDMQWAAAIRESATEIWLAGLGAFSAAQREGNKIFEALVKQGEALRDRTRKVAGERIGELTADAAKRWDKLGEQFEDPLGRAFHRLNLPTKKDIEELNRRIDKLTAATERLSKPTARRGSRSAALRSGAGRA